MDETLNFSDVLNNLGIKLPTVEISELKNLPIQTIEVSSLSDAKKLLNGIKKHEKEAVCICIQYIGKKRRSRLRKYMCIKTMYKLCPLPDSIKGTLHCGEDLEKASISVQPPSIFQLDSEDNETHFQNILSYNVRDALTRKRSRRSAKQSEKRICRGKYGTAILNKGLFQCCRKYTCETKRDSKCVQKDSIAEIQMKKCVAIVQMDNTEYLKRKPKCSDCKVCLNIPKIPRDNSRLSKTKEKRRPSRKQDGCSSDRNGTSNSQVALQTVTRSIDCNHIHKQKTQHVRHRKKSLERIETYNGHDSSLHDVSCNDQSKSTKKQQKSHAENGKNPQNERKNVKQINETENITDTGYMFCNKIFKTCCRHVDNDDTVHTKKQGNLNDIRCNKDNAGFGELNVNIDGINCNATVKLADKLETREECTCCQEKEQLRSSRDANEKQHKCGKKYTTSMKGPSNCAAKILQTQPTKDDSPTYVKRGESIEVLCSDSSIEERSNSWSRANTIKDNCNCDSLINGTDYTERQNKELYESIDCIPGFSFKLNEYKQVDSSTGISVDEDCLIRRQEEQRFLQQELGLQPTTIIMNEPFNVPLRMYEVSSLSRRRYLSTANAN